MTERARPVNVLHILGTAGHEGTGIANIVAALSESLNPERYTVHICFLEGDGPLGQEFRVQGTRVKTMQWSRGIREPIEAWRFFRWIRSEDFAIIHQHFGNRSLRLLARRASQAKIITHFHSNFLEARSLTPIMLRANEADAVIATSRAVGDCVEGGRARVIYPGVKIPRETGSRRSGTDVVLGTAGRLVPMKGIVYLIRALVDLRDLPGITLEIAGAGPELHTLEREVCSLGLSHQVKFLGWRTDVSALLARWDVYVQPSLGEPFGIAALEAMASGLPVVGTSAGGLSELVEHSKTGWLVPQRDPTALADRIRTLILAPEERRKMGAAGRERVRESFSVAHMVRSISGIYEEILREPQNHQ